MAEKKRTRWQRRPGTTGGKLPWNDWRNATTWRKATQLLLLAINIYIAITFWYWVRYYETAGSTTFVADAPRDKCTLSCAINGIHAAFHYLKKNYISGCVMTVPTG